MHLRRSGWLAVAFILLYAPSLYALTVRIAWDANSESDIAGYVLHYGTKSRQYTTSVNVGKVTSWTLTLADNTVYYAALDAYNTAGLHSALSAEVSFGTAPCVFTVAPSSISVGAAGGTVGIGVTTGSGCNWAASSTTAWISVTGGASRSASGTVTLSIATNTGPARSASIVVAGKNVTISQAAAACTISLPTPGAITINHLSGSTSIPVLTNFSTCPWTAAGGAYWLTIAGSASHVGSGSLTLTVSANTTGRPRSATVRAGNAMLYVTQTAVPRKQAVDFDASSTGDAFLYNPNSGAWQRQIWNGQAFTSDGDGVTEPGWNVYPADFNGDERSDLFLYDPATGIWQIWMTRPDGQFEVSESRWAAGWSPTILDLNGDGRSDVFLYNPATGKWFECIAQPSVGFSYVAGQWAKGWSVYRAVLDSNARDDLFLYNANARDNDPNGGLWYRVLTQPDLSFAYVPGEAPWAPGWKVTVADLDGNGRSELFLYGADGHWFVVSFGLATSYVDGYWAKGWRISRADFNGDGRAELFLYNPATGMWFSAFWQSNNAFGYLAGQWVTGWQAAVTDFNGDGISDVALYDPVGGRWAAAITRQPGTFEYAIGTFGTGWQPVWTQVTLP